MIRKMHIEEKCNSVQLPATLSLQGKTVDITVRMDFFRPADIRKKPQIKAEQ